MLGSVLGGAIGQAQENDPGSKAGLTREVSFATSDGGRVFANLRGDGEHAVVLAHGAIFNKESWSELSEVLVANGLRVLAIDFRGYGKSTAGTDRTGLHLDVLAAVRYLHDQGVRRVSVLGGSMGGGAAAHAAAESKKGEIDHLILLAHAPIRQSRDLKGKKLFIVSEGDGLRRSVGQQYESAPQPKKLVVLPGSAHAQHIFRTDHADKLTALIVDTLTSTSSK